MGGYEAPGGRKSHELAAQALDGGVAGLAPPETRWRSLVPPPGWGNATRGGSGNIPWIALVAELVFARRGSFEERHAVERASEGEELNRRLWFFLEFGSWIYTGWTVLCHLVAAVELRRRGYLEAAGRLDRLVQAWLALARLAACPAPDGRVAVVVCGMRSWGHGDGLSFGHHNFYRIAFGLERERAKGAVGSFDGDWPSRVLDRYAPELRALAAPLEHESPAELVRRLAYVPGGYCQLRAYDDGSRVFVIGRDEPELVDEDGNNNTPAVLFFAIDRKSKRVRYAPEHPAPNGGAVRIRQQNIRADLDWTGKLWVLHHSHVGEVREGSWWRTDCREPAAFLAWKVSCDPAFGRWVHSDEGGGISSSPPPDPAPRPDPPPGESPPATPAASGATFDCRLVWYAPGECWVLEGRMEEPLVVEPIQPQGEVPQRWAVKRKGG